MNILKNPQFVFDIDKTDHIDACLSVIAQAFIDACSLSDLQLGKVHPARLLLRQPHRDGAGRAGQGWQRSQPSLPPRLAGAIAWAHAAPFWLSPGMCFSLPAPPLCSGLSLRFAPPLVAREWGHSHRQDGHKVGTPAEGGGHQALCAQGLHQLQELSCCHGRAPAHSAPCLKRFLTLLSCCCSRQTFSAVFLGRTLSTEHRWGPVLHGARADPTGEPSSSCQGWFRGHYNDPIK